MIGLLFGSFDPPHLGHLALAKAALEHKDIEEVWFIPSNNHPQKENKTEYSQRMRMVAQTIAPYRRMILSGIEARMRSGSFTANIIVSLYSEHPNKEFRILFGSDIYMEKESWFAFNAIEKLASPIWFARKGTIPIKGTITYYSLPEISSADIRKKINQGNILDTKHLLPVNVFKYIKGNNLYKSKSIHL